MAVKEVHSVRHISELLLRSQHDFISMSCTAGAIMCAEVLCRNMFCDTTLIYFLFYNAILDTFERRESDFCKLKVIYMACAALINSPGEWRIPAPLN